MKIRVDYFLPFLICYHLPLSASSPDLFSPLTELQGESGKPDTGKIKFIANSYPSEKSVFKTEELTIFFEAIATQIFGSGQNSISVTYQGQSVTEGISGSEIYKIYQTPDNSLLGVFKLYQEQNDFVFDLGAEKQLTNLNPNDFDFPKIIRSGKVLDNRNGLPTQKLFHLYLAANGTPVNDLFKKYRQSGSCQEKHDLQSKLYQSFKAIGSSLKSLHRLTTEKKGSPSQHFLNKIFDDCLEYIPLFKSGAFQSKISIKDLDLDLLKNRLESTHKIALTEKTDLSYFHGDAHTGNFFINLETNKISWIDFSTLLLSVKPGSKPGGIPYWDYYKFMSRTQMIAMLMELPEALINSSLKAFAAEYSLGSSSADLSPAIEKLIEFKNEMNDLEILFHYVDENHPMFQKVASLKTENLLRLIYR